MKTARMGKNKRIVFFILLGLRSYEAFSAHKINSKLIPCVQDYSNIPNLSALKFE